MVPTSATPLPALALAEDTSQPLPQPLVEPDEGEGVTVLEIFKPAHQGPVDVRDDGLKALPVSASGFGSDGVFELLLTLPARPVIASLEMVAQKIKAARLRGVHNPCLGRMQFETGLRRPRLHPLKRGSSFGFSSTQDHEVVRVPHHLDAHLGQMMIEGIEIDVGKQRADDRALGSSFLGRPPFRRLHDLLGQKRFDQVQHLAVGHLCAHPLQQRLMRDRVEVAFQVRIDHPTVPFLQQGVDAPQRVLRAPIRSEPVALRREVPLEDRLQHRSERRLHHPVAHRRNPQGAFLLAPRFGNPHPPDRLRTIATVLQRPREFLQVLLQVALELLHRLVIDSRRPFVRLHSLEGLAKIRQGRDLIHQAVPLASDHSLFESRQHSFRPNFGFDPGPSSPNLSGGRSPCGHCVRLLPRFVRHVSTFLRSLRSGPITALLRYYGRSDSCPLGAQCSGSSQRPRSRLLRGQVSLIHALGLPTIPPPNTCGLSASPGHAPHQRVGPRLLPLSGDLGLRLCYAGSPNLTGRIEFVVLRTSRSTPIALHPVLRRRSYLRLQVASAWRGLPPLRPSALSDARSGGFMPPIGEVNSPLQLRFWARRERSRPIAKPDPPFGWWFGVYFQLPGNPKWKSRVSVMAEIARGAREQSRRRDAWPGRNGDSLLRTVPGKSPQAG